MRKLILLAISVILLTFTVSGAANQYNADSINGYNSVDVYLNGSKVFSKNEDTTNARGETIPGSIMFKDTTYLPLRKMGESLGLDVNWDGSVKLNEKSSSGDIKYEAATYGNKIDIKGIPSNHRIAFVESLDGNVVDGLDVDKNADGVTIQNAYTLSLNTSYHLNVVYADRIETIGFRTSGISLSSFSENGNAWEVVVPANPSKGFHHPYVIRIPKRSGSVANDLAMTKSTMLAEGSNEFVTQNNAEVVSKVLNTYSGWYSAHLSDRGSYVMMMSMFPRPAQDGSLYTHSLDRDSLFSSKEKLDKLGRGNLYRIDIQYDRMIADALAVLKSIGKTLDNNVFLIGFSASSDFATRFNYTHPDRAKAVVVNSAPTLPLTKYKNEILRFPLGVGDLAEVTGQAFDVNKFKDTPQFWHTGTKDNNDGTYYGDGWGNYGDENNNWNQEGIDYRRLFGDEIVARKSLIRQILDDAGFSNIIHKEYPGVDHGWNEEIIIDALKFLDKYK